MTEPKIPSFSVLIVAGGTGSRLGGDTPKQYQRLNDISVLEQSIKIFSSCSSLGQIHLVCDPSHHEFVRDTLLKYHLPSPSPAGKDRKESVFNGLNGFSGVGSEEIILIHDAARPLISKEDVERVVRSAAENGSATLAVPVADTLTRADGTPVDREGLWSIQTPQAFRYGLIREAHDRFKDQGGFTDDASLVRAMGHAVVLVPGNRRNFKITTPNDLEMARTIMNTFSSNLSSSRRRPGSLSEDPAREPGRPRDDGLIGFLRAFIPSRQTPVETRTALGFDVHAFDPDKSGPIRLGGVDIPHHCTLAGHSDADVGLHAITDALLGTIAAGDIGQHFPPSDPQWKGADSTIFLKRAVEILHEKNAVITLIDLIFMCEEPKIGPHREAMQRVIAEITGITPDRISIKATTTEKLGFTGRKEGIAAQALATVQIPGLKKKPRRTGV
jgi:2-C-methyl-D-erythritol 4-phosphate cytidylyltransferase/2-C-methyl-D-erythritol 2,4-cyclodiphosphate synthase